MRRNLENWRVIVTGGSGGIGRALANALATAGANVCNFARRSELLESWQAEHTNRANQVTVFAGDVTNTDDRRGAIDHVKQLWGGIDGLINNAGLGALGRFEQSEAETLRKVFEVNFFAAVEFTRSVLPILKTGHAPMIVNIGSILGHRATPQNSEYCASKFALRAWSESIRPEFAKIGIDLLLVSPGSTESEFYQHTLGSKRSPPWTSPKPVTAEVVAQKTITAMQAGKSEIIPNTNGKLLLLANRLCPTAVNWYMKKYG